MHIFCIFFPFYIKNTLSIDKVSKPETFFTSVLGKIAHSPNSNANPKPNPDPDRGGGGGDFPWGQFSGLPLFLIILTNLNFKFQLRDMIIAFPVK